MPAVLEISTNGTAIKNFIEWEPLGNANYFSFNLNFQECSYLLFYLIEC